MMEPTCVPEGGKVDYRHLSRKSSDSSIYDGYVKSDFKGIRRGYYETELQFPFDPEKPSESVGEKDRVCNRVLERPSSFVRRARSRMEVDSEYKRAWTSVASSLGVSVESDLVFSTYLEPVTVGRKAPFLEEDVHRGFNRVMGEDIGHDMSYPHPMEFSNMDLVGCTIYPSRTGFVRLFHGTVTGGEYLVYLVLRLLITNTMTI